MLIIDKVANKPLVIFNPSRVMNTEDHDQVASTVQAINEFLSQQPEQTFLILDTRGVAIGFDTMIHNLKIINQQNHLFAHPKLRETLVLTDSKLLTQAVKGLNSPVFGNLHLKAFALMEDALTYVDSQLVAQ